MPTDEQDERPVPPTEDENAPVTFEESSGAPLAPLTPKGRRAGWRRVVNRRNAIWTAVVAIVAALALVLIIFVLYRTGRIDRIIAGQIVDTLAKYNIRAEIGSFETKFSPRTVELRDVKLYNAVTGAQIGQIDRILAKVRIEDMYAISFRRNVNLEELTIDHPEIWVVYDAKGRSNFSELKIPPPDPNSRILFAYSTAHVQVNGAVVHYDDRRYDISGEARNVRAVVRPEDPNAPAESRANLIDLWMNGSTFAFEGRPVNPIDVEAHARANQLRADISELVLRSPVAEAHLSGALDDWRALRYHMQVNATVDLTQTSDVLQLGTTMRGMGKFEGTVAGEGDKYKVEGTVVSDALAADGVRLKALNVNAVASGQGKSYEAQGKAVAELLTAGDFQLNLVQLAGGVTGTGTDFRWLGELRAAAARNGATSITGLILKDAVAEMRDGKLSGSAQAASATSVLMQGTRVGGVEASGVRFAQSADGTTRAEMAGARAGTIVSNGTTIRGVQASGVDATINADSSASVTVDRVQVGGLNAAGARTGSINIAGVRLAISPTGRVEGTSNDIGVGTVAFTVQPAGKEGKAQEGRAENVRLAHPRFTLEPGGRYRASADLSLGGGVLGTMNLGRARAAVVATNDQIQLNDFVADIFNGHAQGSATIATNARAQSVVRAKFEGVDAGGLATLLSGNAVPIVGAATGTVDLRFPGTNFRVASGRVDATFNGATGRDETARTPLTGSLAVTADRGLFQIERANISAGATELNATGRFSFQGGSDLAVNLNSTDASEFQTILFSTGLLSSIEGKVNDLSIQLAGNLRFNGNVTGDLDSPLVNGRFELSSLTVRGQNLGALSADIVSNATETRVNNGKLVEPDGGGATFTAVIPRTGENNISFDATLENANAGNLLAAFGVGEKRGGGLENLPSPTEIAASNLTGLGPASGKISVTGFPGAMTGSADLRVAAGRIGNQPYEEIVARATFSGSRVNIETVDTRLAAGRINGTGTIDIEAKTFDLHAQGTDVNLELVKDLLPGRQLPPLSGTVNFTAAASGNLIDPTTYRAEINAQGRDVVVNGQAAGELTLVGHTTADQKFVLDLTTGLLGKPQVVHATVDLAGENLPASVETTLTGADLTPLFAAMLNNPNNPEAPKVKVTGHATGTVKASGPLMNDEGAFTFEGLSGRAEFTDLVVQFEDVPLTAESPLVVTFKPNEVTFEKTRFTGPGTNINIGGTAAIGAGGTQDLNVNGDLNMRVLSNAQRNFFLSGIARMGVHVGGNYEQPEITGTASVAGASLALLISDQRLTATDINGMVRFNANQASIETLTGRLGGGRVNATGGATIEGTTLGAFRIAAHADNATVPAAAFVTLPAFLGNLPTTADADLVFSGNAERLKIEGAVNVRRTEITQNIDLADLINQQGETPITEGGGGGLFGTTTLDLTITGRDALFVRNNLADAVGSLNLRVYGPSETPVKTGRISMTRGTLAFRNDRYEIQRAIIDLPPRADADPIVNVQAQSDIKGYRVTVTMSGPLSGGLQTTATSDPPLPQADVIALITTGNLSGGPEGTSAIAQTGLGTATSLLTDTLINAPVQKATDKLFGLNRFEFDPVIAGRGGQSPTARLTVGRQINRNLAITFSTNVTGEPNQVIAVEYRVSDRLSFIAQYQQGSTDTLRTRSNNFGFELRFRKRY